MYNRGRYKCSTLNTCHCILSWLQAFDHVEGFLNYNICTQYSLLTVCVRLIVDVKQEKTHQGLMAGVEAAPKLRHAETEEKVVLPSADGKFYLPAPLVV